MKLSRAPAVALVLGSSAAVGVGYIGIGFSRTIVAACILSVVGGLGNGVQWVSVMTLLQERTPTDYQARISGLLESVAAAAPAAGFLIGGALTTLASPATAYVVAGAGVLVLVGLAAAFGRGRVGASDLDDDRDDHGPPLEAVVDELGQVVVQQPL